MAIENFNRIINLKFYSPSDKQIPAETITCPVRGRKPYIEITGQYIASDVSQVFNVVIRNLYLDFTEHQYTELEVEAGYEGNVVIAFRGSILYALKESPGPESKTVIQCQLCDVTALQGKIVNIEIADDNTTLKDVLTEFCRQTGYPSPAVSDAAGALTSGEGGIMLYGRVTDVLSEIKKRYDRNGDLRVLIDSISISAYLDGEDKPIKKDILTFLSAPPQLVGGGENAVVATIVAPWRPDLRPGDVITFDTDYYTTVHILGYRQKTITMQIATIQVHFSTCKGANQMTVIGNVIPNKEGSNESN